MQTLQRSEAMVFSRAVMFREQSPYSSYVVTAQFSSIEAKLNV